MADPLDFAMPYGLVFRYVNNALLNDTVSGQAYVRLPAGVVDLMVTWEHPTSPLQVMLSPTQQQVTRVEKIRLPAGPRTTGFIQGIGVDSAEELYLSLRMTAAVAPDDVARVRASVRVITLPPPE